MPEVGDSVVAGHLFTKPQCKERQCETNHLHWSAPNSPQLSEVCTTPDTQPITDFRSRVPATADTPVLSYGRQVRFVRHARSIAISSHPSPATRPLRGYKSSLGQASPRRPKRRAQRNIRYSQRNQFDDSERVDHGLSVGLVFISVNTADRYTTPKKSSPANLAAPCSATSRFNSTSCHGSASGW